MSVVHKNLHFYSRKYAWKVSYFNLTEQAKCHWLNVTFSCSKTHSSEDVQVEWQLRSTHPRHANTVWCGNLTEMKNLEDLGLDGRIILKWLFKKIVTTLRAGGWRNRHSAVKRSTLFPPGLYTLTVGPNQLRIHKVLNSLYPGLKNTYAWR